MINGISSAPSTAFYRSRCLEPGSGGRIIDVKFLNDDILLALCHSKGMPQKLRNVFPFRKLTLLPQDGEPNLRRILFRPVSPHYEANESGFATLSHGSPVPSVRVMEFPEDVASFVPVRMEVMEASDARGGVPARVCLLGKDEVTYKVYSLPDQAQILEA